MTTKDVGTRSGLWRSRWAAIGAAVAVSIGAGTVVHFASAAETGPRLTFTPVTTCRLFDTRPGVGHVGDRNTPLGQGETLTVQVTGEVGQCKVPEGADAVTMRVTILSGSSLSRLYVWNADLERPAISSMNGLSTRKQDRFEVELSADGKVSFYNSRLRTHIAVDITGYYLPVAKTVLPDQVITRNSCLATQRWEQPICKRDVYDAGDGPSGIAFDGRNLWVANSLANTVSRINPNNGEKVDFAVGTDPQQVVFDGTDIWVSNRGSNNVSRVNILSGEKTDYETPAAPYGMVFDGTHVWVSTGASQVVRFEVGTGNREDFPGIANARFMTFDGRNIWTGTTSNAIRGFDRKGDAVASIGAGRTGLEGIAFDGVSVWVASADNDKVVREAVYGNGSTDITTGNSPKGVLFDGDDIWVMNTLDDTVSVINRENGMRADLPTCDNPQFAAFDGARVWVTCLDSDNIMSFPS